ncbi:lysoplasmalogenase family protein [Clostridium manihotivorum]|uniref:lysoplasmalogenase family protein n=1 Tax=Clostridium manihotivorum TaxID=2320868 RepID=UPI0013E2AD3B|nr:lysoplasmalogenase family protein [Clostridium manihotivorum]
MCFILTLLIGTKGYDNADRNLLQLAFFFTSIADFFLIIKNYYTLGVLFFILVQVTYIIRHSRKKFFNSKYIMVDILVFAALITTAILFKPDCIDNSLYIIALIYGYFLLNSLIIAWSTLSKEFYKKVSSFMIAIGMTLFFLCDINVGLYQFLVLCYDTPSLEIIYFLVWFFYLPSQLLLSLSGYKEKIL